MSSQAVADIARSTASNAYHVADAVRDAAAIEVAPLYHARAAEIMGLALGVGISMAQSRALVAAKLAAWARTDP